MTDKFTIALPSKGVIEEPTSRFLKECGLPIYKPNPRQYTGSMPAIPGMKVLFQRVADVVYKVADGTVELGITGLDVVLEYLDPEIVIIHEGLGYGHCALTVAVPESWIDVESVADLADVALDFREMKRRNLRVASKFTNLTRKFLHANGIHHFTMVKAEGAIEAAPTIGYADVIVDLVQTGTTLRENHLKTLKDGVIIESQACLIGNRSALCANQELISALRVMLEYIDAALRGRKYSQVTVNIQGESAEDIAQRVASNALTRGLLGPTIAPIYSTNGSDKAYQWYTVTITVETTTMLKAVEHLRTIGAMQVVVAPVDYVFLQESPTFVKLIEQLELQ